jgi:hypothetical protein
MKTVGSKQTLKQLRINLNEIKHPNPAILKAYQDANAEDYWIDRNKPEFQNEKRLFLSHEASGAQIKHAIFFIYRKQLNNGKEFCLFFNSMVCSDYFSNKVMHTRRLGKYEKPIITRPKSVRVSSIKPNQINEAKPEPGPPVIDTVETVYEYPWAQVKDQLRKWYDDGTVTDDCQYYVITSRENYGVKCSFDQFLDLPIEDLILLSVHGKKYAGLLKTGDPIDTILDRIRERVKDGVRVDIGAK